MKNCTNCGNRVSGLYCSKCGQKGEVERITFHHILHEVVHFFTHAEKGFLFTTLQMLKAPGRAVKNFIDGKRKNYQPPLSYFLIWNAVYLLLLYFVGSVFGENKVVNFAEYFGPAEKTKFAISHLNIVLTTLLPFQALYVYLGLVYRKYNYFEALVAILYAIGTLLVMQLVFVIAAIPLYLFSGVSVNIQLSDILKVLYVGWFMFDFVKVLPVKHKYLRATIVLLLAFGTFTAWRLYVFPAAAELFF
ncbi:MAG: DUF3667 domain-containing protein [Bacteroidota bacterium]